MEKKKKTKKNDLARRFENYELPDDWDFKKSVKKNKPRFAKWESATKEFMIELWHIRKKLSKSGAAGHVKNLSGTKVPLETWSQYCRKIGSSRQVVNRLLFRDFGSMISSKHRHITAKGKLTKKIRERTRKGDLWILGRNRLLCGDAANKDDVEWLFYGQHGSITITSPPYNLGPNTQSGKPRYINYKDNLSPEEYSSLLMNFTSLALKNCEYVFVTLQQCARNKGPIEEYLYKRKDVLGGTLIWDKIHVNPARTPNVCGSQFEFVFYFNEQGKKQIDTVPFRKPISDVIRISSKERRPYSDKHKGSFPLKFAAHFIDNFTAQKHIVYDPFVGTGTTLIACEKLGRRCYAMELKPKTCDLVLQWWEDETKEKAIRCERDGLLWKPDGTIWQRHYSKHLKLIPSDYLR